MVGDSVDIRKEFEQNIVVLQNDCDLNSRMKLSALLRKVQQISTDHCTALGIKDEDYKRTKSAFLLAKMTVEIYSDIMVGDRLRLVTHPGVAQRIVYPRYTEIFNDENQLLAAVDARWILIDTEKRTIRRRCPEDLVLNFGNETVSSLDISIPKCTDGELVGRERVNYSRADLNRHLNNTEYADIICDHLPIELMNNKAIRKFSISYHNEIKLGESVDIYRKELENGWNVWGELPDKCSFEAFVQF